MMLRAVVADDEPLAVRRLLVELARIETVDVVGVAKDGEEALRLIRKRKPNLVFLDIAMPNLSGIDVVEAIDTANPPAVIFISAHDQFAVQAFRTGATDYLLKPLDGERLREAVGRARTALEHRQAELRLAELKEVVAALRSQAAERGKQHYEDSIWVTRKGQLARIAVGDVIWFESDGDYVRIHTAEQEHFVHQSLRGLEQKLDPAEFVRVHRQAIVRIKSVVSLERGSFGSVRIHLANGASTNVGRSYRHALQSILEPRG